MSKLMWVLGILLVAAGVALGLLTTYSPGKMQAYGLLPDTAALLFVGGILSIGLGGVIDALRNNRMAVPDAKSPIAVVPAKPADEDNNLVKLPVGFGRKAADATATTAAATAAAGAILSSTSSIAAQTAKTSVSDTIAALDEAKADIKKALGGMDDMTGTRDRPPVPPISLTETTIASSTIAQSVPAEPEEEELDTDPELYVVEEKIIRGRPARILSDETVEAETDEGWMRFENLEHLNEYIDSTEEPDA